MYENLKFDIEKAAFELLQLKEIICLKIIKGIELERQWEFINPEATDDIMLLEKQINDNISYIERLSIAARNYNNKIILYHNKL